MGYTSESLVAINNAETQNAVMIRSSESLKEKHCKSAITISHDAVDTIVALIRNNPCIMDFNDETLWKKDDLDQIRTTGIYNAILFGDGDSENTIGEFGLWDYEDGAEGTLKIVFELFHKIKDILLKEGVPEDYFKTYDEEPLFEGYEIRDYKRINPKNPALSTLGDLYQILTSCWKAETAYPSDQKDWTEDVPSYGQCAITAMLVYDLFGGEMYRTKDHSHYYNRIDGHWVDLTADQFWAYGDECDYEAGEKIERRYVGRSGHTKQRYDMLVKNIQDYLESFIEYPPKDGRGPCAFCGGDWIPDPDKDAEF